MSSNHSSPWEWFSVDPTCCRCMILWLTVSIEGWSSISLTTVRTKTLTFVNCRNQRCKMAINFNFLFLVKNILHLFKIGIIHDEHKRTMKTAVRSDFIAYEYINICKWSIIHLTEWCNTKYLYSYILYI